MDFGLREYSSYLSFPKYFRSKPDRPCLVLLLYWGLIIGVLVQAGITVFWRKSGGGVPRIASESERTMINFPGLTLIVLRPWPSAGSASGREQDLATLKKHAEEAGDVKAQVQLA